MGDARLSRAMKIWLNQFERHMYSQLLLALVGLVSVAAFVPHGRTATNTQVSMGLEQSAKKMLGVAALGFALAGPAMPLPADADGPISKYTVYSTRNNCGTKIMGLEKAVASGDH